MSAMQADGESVARLCAEWDFVCWADRRMVEAARSIADPAEYARDRGISHGSVHALLLHMMDGQRGWLAVWRGDGAGLPDTSAAACPDLAAIERVWPAVHDAVGRFLKTLTTRDLARPVRFTRRGRELTLPLGECIAHLIDHAGYHRGQLNTLVKQAGGRRVWLSRWVYSVGQHRQADGTTDGDFLHA